MLMVTLTQCQKGEPQQSEPPGKQGTRHKQDCAWPRAPPRLQLLTWGREKLPEPDSSGQRPARSAHVILLRQRTNSSAERNAPCTSRELPRGTGAPGQQHPLIPKPFFLPGIKRLPAPANGLSGQAAQGEKARCHLGRIPAGTWDMGMATGEHRVPPVKVQHPASPGGSTGTLTEQILPTKRGDLLPQGSRDLSQAPTSPLWHPRDDRGANTQVETLPAPLPQQPAGGCSHRPG